MAVFLPSHTAKKWRSIPLQNLAPLPQSRTSTSKPWTALFTLPASYAASEMMFTSRLLIADSCLPFIGFGILMGILIKDIDRLMILGFQQHRGIDHCAIDVFNRRR